MKKIIVLLPLMVIFFVSCEKAPQDTATIVGSWQTVHEHITFTNYDDTEEITDTDVAQADSYRMTFNEDGSGKGSLATGADNRYEFDFTWETSEDRLVVSGVEDMYVFGIKNGPTVPNVTWTVEELTAGKLILSFLVRADVDGVDYDGNSTGGEISVFYRLIFTKVE